MKKGSKKFNIMRWTIWILAVLFYFYEFIIRVMPSVMANQIMAAFSIDGGTFGSVSAAYMYAYAPMQLPVGVLMDKYGARRLMTVGALLCGVGAILFGLTESLHLAQFGRFLTGMGSAFAFVSLIYVCSHWFSGKSVALLIGLGNSLGVLGAICGQGPLSYFVNSIGWRATSIGIGVIGLILCVIIFLLVRNEPKGMEKHDTAIATYSELFRNLKKVAANKKTWLMAMISLCAYMPTVSFAGLWAVPFVQEVYGVSNTVAGYAASMIFVGWILGGPLIGHYSDVVQRRKPFLIGMAIVSLILLSAVIYPTPYAIVELFLVMIALGVALSVQLLTYSAVIECNEPEAKGSALAITNFFVFLGASISQPLVGALLDIHSTEQVIGKMATYTHANFSYALSLFTLSLVAFCILALFFKEKSKKTIVKDEFGQ